MGSARRSDGFVTMDEKGGRREKGERERKTNKKREQMVAEITKELKPRTSWGKNICKKISGKVFRVSLNEAVDFKV